MQRRRDHTAGKYSEAIFKGLDFVIAECAKRGLRLMLTLTNYWTHFGGMPQYIKCAAGA
jgi:mannan endo-1,4-beta-mannosidase